MLQNDFDRKLGTNTILSRKGKTSKSFQDRALARRLIAAHDKLWKIDVIADTASSQISNLLEPTGRFRRVESRKSDTLTFDILGVGDLCDLAPTGVSIGE